MSLTVNANQQSSIAPIPQGTYLAVCYMLVDLGMQYSEAFKKSSRKVLIGWEVPEETITIDGEERPRIITKQYTASLNESASLRQDLAAWRGRDFTQEELEAFDLRNIVGTSCMINVVHKVKKDGKTFANIQSIMALPKGMPKGELDQKPVIFDLDTSEVEQVDGLPGWIADMIKKSSTYQEKLVHAPEMTEAEDDERLPF